jgi:ABC-2 type transport system permease protein
MNAPRDLIDAGWFRVIATVNPISYLLEFVRSLIITGWDGTALALGFAVAAAIAIVSLGLATRALRQRMTRT